RTSSGVTLLRSAWISWPIFSSSVMRDSRSAIRASSPGWLVSGIESRGQRAGLATPGPPATSGGRAGASGRGAAEHPASKNVAVRIAEHLVFMRGTSRGAPSAIVPRTAIPGAGLLLAGLPYGLEHPIGGSNVFIVHGGDDPAYELAHRRANPFEKL